MCDDPAMWTLGLPPLEIVIRTVIVYLFFVAALRIFGKREIGQFTLFDLALVLLVANALQPAMTGPDQSIPGGAIIIVTIFALNGILAQLRRRVPFVRRLLEFEPTVIGNQVWPISWAVIQNSSLPLSGIPSKAIPGYSMPEEPPATLTAVG